MRYPFGIKRTILVLSATLLLQSAAWASGADEEGGLLPASREEIMAACDQATWLEDSKEYCLGITQSLEGHGAVSVAHIKACAQATTLPGSFRTCLAAAIGGVTPSMVHECSRESFKFDDCLWRAMTRHIAFPNGI